MCHTAHELTLHIPTHAKAFCLVDEALKLRRLLLSPRPSSTPFDSYHFLLSFRVSTGAFASKHSRPRRKSLHSRQCTRRSRGRHSPRFVYFSTCRLPIATLNQNKPLLLHIILLENALFGHEACAFTGWRGGEGEYSTNVYTGTRGLTPYPLKMVSTGV